MIQEMLINISLCYDQRRPQQTHHPDRPSTHCGSRTQIPNRGHAHRHKSRRLRGAGAADEAVVAGGASVGDGAGVLAVAVDDDAVGAGGAAVVGLAALEREFVPGRRDGEAEALVVLVLVRVRVGADGLAVLQVVAGGVGRVGDVVGRVVVVAAGGGRLALGERVGGGDGGQEGKGDLRWLLVEDSSREGMQGNLTLTASILTTVWISGGRSGNDNDGFFCCCYRIKKASVVERHPNIYPLPQALGSHDQHDDCYATTTPATTRHPQKKPSHTTSRSGPPISRRRRGPKRAQKKQYRSDLLHATCLSGQSAAQDSSTFGADCGVALRAAASPVASAVRPLWRRGQRCICLVFVIALSCWTQELWYAGL